MACALVKPPSRTRHSVFLSVTRHGLFLSETRHNLCPSGTRQVRNSLFVICFILKCNKTWHVPDWGRTWFVPQSDGIHGNGLLGLTHVHIYNTPVLTLQADDHDTNYDYVSPTPPLFPRSSQSLTTKVRHSRQPTNDKRHPSNQVLRRLA